jgi:hypothetical protein
LKQVDLMRELIRTYANDHESIFKEYSNKEDRGEVARKRRALSSIDYAKLLYHNVIRKDARRDIKVSPSSQTKSISVNISKSIIQRSDYSSSDLRNCYDQIANIANLSGSLESFNVIEMVDKYRNYWKPEKVKVILLAESHVFTQISEMNAKINIGNYKLNGYFQDYVRFVYCLGYGEDSLIVDKNFLRGKNVGTLPFWKIFYSCCNEITKSNYNSVYNSLKKTLPKDSTRKLRILTKIDLLQKMQRSGIWLVDTSIVGLYKPGNQRFTNNFSLYKNIISTSWNNYVKRIIVDTRPNYIICIGRGVGGILYEDLGKMKTDKIIDGYEVCYLPSARLPSDGHMNNFMRYYEICKQYCNF